jgi:tol-pal system protein YbgF
MMLVTSTPLWANTTQMKTQLVPQSHESVTTQAHHEVAQLIQNEVLQALVSLSEQVNELSRKTEKTNNALEILQREQSAQEKLIKGFITPPPGATQNQTAPTNNSITTTSKPTQTPAEKAFHLGFFFIKAGHLKQADNAFSTFLKSYPNHPQTDEALYWKGFISLQEKSYTSAEKIFSSLVKRFPLSKRYPEAQLQLAIIDEKNNHFEKALLTYEMLIKKYPKTQSAKTAQKKINQLSGILKS